MQWRLTSDIYIFLSKWLNDQYFHAKVELEVFALDLPSNHIHKRHLQDDVEIGDDDEIDDDDIWSSL